MVALHDSAISATRAKPGETHLSLEGDDIEELKELLQAAGYQDATVWEEAYGRVLSVTAPGDAVVWVDQRSDDRRRQRTAGLVGHLRPSSSYGLLSVRRRAWPRWSNGSPRLGMCRRSPAAASASTTRTASLSP
jgi:hypothetical protein